MCLLPAAVAPRCYLVVLVCVSVVKSFVLFLSVTIALGKRDKMIGLTIAVATWSKEHIKRERILWEKFRYASTDVALPTHHVLSYSVEEKYMVTKRSIRTIGSYG